MNSSEDISAGSRPCQSLSSKSIVIVGGTTGLGLSAAKACINAGANVVVVGRNRDSAAHAERQLGPKAVAVVGDAIDSATTTSAINCAKSHFQRFDALYHVAGGSGRRFGDGPLHELTDEGIHQTLESNLTSLIKSNRAAVRALLDAGNSGVILNMGSVLGMYPAPRHFATHAYSAAKSAVVGFTKSCAAYYANKNIRFNVIAPALVVTPMSQRAVGDLEITNYIRTKQPLEGGRVGNPEDLDAAVVFLLSDASRYVTGQIITVDGGWSVSEGQVAGEPLDG